MGGLKLPEFFCSEGGMFLYSVTAHDVSVHTQLHFNFTFAFFLTYVHCLYGPGFSVLHLGRWPWVLSSLSQEMDLSTVFSI